MSSHRSFEQKAHSFTSCRFPDLYKRHASGEIGEAILDLVVEWPGAGRPHLIDVTGRCPHAVRCPNSAIKAGVAAVTGEKDKRDHYGPAVSPFAVESLGRFGEGARICLAELAADASRCGKARIGRVIGLDVKKLRLWVGQFEPLPTKPAGSRTISASLAPIARVLA